MKLSMIQKEPVEFDASDVLKSIGMPSNHRFADTICDLLEKTKDIAHPKMFYLECPVEKRTPSAITINGVTFHSKLLVAKLHGCETVYPYIATCGAELAEYAGQLRDIADSFAFDAIMDFYRKIAEKQLWDAVHDLLPEGKVTGHLYPGSLPGWEIVELKELFSLFGREADALGVVLNDGYMMSPLKSVAGVAYAAEEEISDCACCRKEHCGQRTEPFNAKAYLRTLYRI